MHQSFLTVARYRYALYAALLAAAATMSYIVDSWREHPSGGTMLGYTLGGISTALVLFLLCYGIRRRSFGGSAGSTRHWLSMHVYFGLCVVIVATFHSGLQFGLNIHTLAYVLLCAVVVSGCWGVYAYLRYPALMVRERGETGRDELQARLHEADRQAMSLARKLEPGVSALISDAVLRTRLGGGVWAQLRGCDDSMLMVTPVREHGFSRLVSNGGQQALIAQLAKYQATNFDSDNHQALQALLRIAGEKAVLVKRLRRDIQLQALLQIWLYIHIPLSFIMLAALLGHIFAVFYYW